MIPIALENVGHINWSMEIPNLASIGLSTYSLSINPQTLNHNLAMVTGQFLVKFLEFLHVRDQSFLNFLARMYDCVSILRAQCR